MRLSHHDLAKTKQENIKQFKIVNIWLYQKDWPSKCYRDEVNVGYDDQRLGLARWVEQEQKGGLLDWKKSMNKYVELWLSMWSVDK